MTGGVEDEDRGKTRKGKNRGAPRSESALGPVAQTGSQRALTAEEKIVPGHDAHTAVLQPANATKTASNTSNTIPQHCSFPGFEKQTTLCLLHDSLRVLLWMF